MKIGNFGFELGSFGVALTAEKFLVIGSKGSLKLSLLKRMGIGALRGSFTIKLHANGTLIFEGPVEAKMAEHPKEPEPFLVLEVIDAVAVAEVLRGFEGQHVSAEFVAR